MTERWRKRLGEVSLLGPSPDLWGRIESGTPTSASRGGTPRRIAVALLALAVAAGGTYVGWQALGDRPVPGPAASPGGYFLRFPDQISVTDDPNGGADVVLATNLPEGTRANTAGGWVSVQGGRLLVLMNNWSCYNFVGSVGNSPGFTLDVSIRPVYDHPTGFDGIIIPGPTPSPTPDQPASVYEILGERFERLEGPDVTTDGDLHQIVISREYEWPEDSCRATRESELFMPAVCPMTRVQPQAESLEGVMSEIVGGFAQERLCGLWDSLTPEAADRHPWPEFRDELHPWLHSQGSFGSSETHDLTWRKLSLVGDRHEVVLLLRARPIARIVMVPLRDHPGAHQPNIVPFWGIDEYILLQAPPA